MWQKENKPEWKKSGIRFFIFYMKLKRIFLWLLKTGAVYTDKSSKEGNMACVSAFFDLCLPPPCGQQMVWQLQSHQQALKKKKSKQRHSSHCSLLYSSNFKIYWDWLVFANNSQANSSTKHEVRKRLGRLVGPVPTSKQEAHGWL